jgi:hypothetical protein
MTNSFHIDDLDPIGKSASNILKGGPGSGRHPGGLSVGDKNSRDHYQTVIMRASNLAHDADSHKDVAQLHRNATINLLQQATKASQTGDAAKLKAVSEAINQHLLAANAHEEAAEHFAAGKSSSDWKHTLAQRASDYADLATRRIDEDDDTVGKSSVVKGGEGSGRHPFSEYVSLSNQASEATKLGDHVRGGKPDHFEASRHHQRIARALEDGVKMIDGARGVSRLRSSFEKGAQAHRDAAAAHLAVMSGSGDERTAQLMTEKAEKASMKADDLNYS